MKIQLLLLLYAGVISAGHAQFETITNVEVQGVQHGQQHHVRHTAYLGILGNGGLYSLSYDLSWPVGKSRMSVGIGGGYLPRSALAACNEEWTSYPVQLNWIHGRKERMEHGLGATYLVGHNQVETSNTYDEKSLVSRSIWFVVKPIAYRLQRQNGGFFFRIQGNLWIKRIELDQDWISYVETHGEPHRTVAPGIGVDIGYTFKTDRS